MREERIDTIKGFLIILVIYGHCVCTFGTGWMNMKMEQFIWTFHMPLFIFISGYLMKRNSETSTFIIKNAKLLKTFLIFHLACTGLAFLQGEPTGIWTFLVPWWSLWYLLSLVFRRIMLKITPPPN